MSRRSRLNAPAHAADFTKVGTLAHTATQYVTTDGNDARNGLTWETGKATVQAAINALPVNGGKVYLGYGSHSVASYGRWTSSTFTSGSATVADTGATSADVGRWVIAPHLPDLAQITSVVVGTSYTTAVPANVTGTIDTIITAPAIVIPAGVELIGLGSAWQDTQEVHYAPQNSTTEILDTGTGVTIIPKKFYLAANQSQDYMRVGLSDLTVRGQNTNMFGFFGENIWYGVATNVMFMSHGMAGAVLGYNLNSTAFRDCRFFGNGTVTATRITGGALLSTPNSSASSSVQFDNCFFSNNYGFGVAATNSRSTATWTKVSPINTGTLLNCQFNHIETTTVTDSGTGAYISGENSQGVLIGCWFETCALRPVMVSADPGAVTFIACHFNGANGHGGNAQLCVLINNGQGSPRPSGAVFIGCYFRNATNSYIQVGSVSTVSWMGCQTDQGTSSITFIAVNGGENVPSSQAPGIGQVGRFASKPFRSVAKCVATGTATLVAGTVAVADTAITASAIVRLSRQAAGGTLGQLSVALTAGTGFAINSNSSTDTSLVYYEVVSY
jgi:hypothetical protein